MIGNTFKRNDATGLIIDENQCSTWGADVVSNNIAVGNSDGGMRAQGVAPTPLHCVTQPTESGNVAYNNVPFQCEVIVCTGKP